MEKKQNHSPNITKLDTEKSDNTYVPDGHYCLVKTTKNASCLFKNYELS